jgi:hypothetical protein
VHQDPAKSAAGLALNAKIAHKLDTPLFEIAVINGIIDMVKGIHVTETYLNGVAKHGAGF